MGKERIFQSLSDGELSKKEDEFYEQITNKKDLLLKILDEIDSFALQIKLIEEEWNAREQ